jgi:predicted HicB family RNase H-like nuclease
MPHEIGEVVDFAVWFDDTPHHYRAFEEYARTAAEHSRPDYAAAWQAAQHARDAKTATWSDLRTVEQRYSIALQHYGSLTNDLVDEIVEEVRRKGGRPSLTGDASVSPRVSFRVTPGVRERAAIIAEREGKTISQLAREALEARVRAS